MAPVQGMQGEVEIIYQILGSDRQRMVSAAPHASDFLRRNRHSNRSLPLAVSVSGKRDFGAREKCAETTCRLYAAVSENEPSAQIPANPGPFVLFQESSANAELRGGGCSPDRTGLHPKFPASREFSREFFEKRASENDSRI